MTIGVLRDPRRYLLALMAVALTIVVPLTFVFVTMMDRVFGPDSSLGWIVLWVVVGIVAATLLVGMLVVLGRASQPQEWEHDAPDNW
jgi:hypothetical protein